MPPAGSSPRMELHMSPLARSLVASALAITLGVALAVTVSHGVFGLPAWVTLGVVGVVSLAGVVGVALGVHRFRREAKARHQGNHD